ncbi:hypothetical protein FD30_GL000806 [Levilactobacillus namurensis DSM 19117]|uniref:Uncharacterized protein n=1 Tax=Levilactobacillus namurensis DSM 19117 TaxID=1423773 RepID=A0A0R1K112_9LACO|nr:hypothetical protein [Levilactobacillus namurensis]KRK73063.1 hypothetical protein FD30_GL000806 [Levilactobacillus namurensis DSM 19117]HJE45480.1 hypothetical protein [Levilactobacillus namurensis]
MIKLTHKQRWAAVSVVLYLVFVIAAITTGFLDPSKIGLQWTIFWYFTGAGLAYYFYFKNYSYREVIYYAQKLGLHKTDLLEMAPDLKHNQDVPDPDHPSFLSPFAQVPITVVNALTDQLLPQADAQHIPRYK